jgi:hypothetical protein
MKKILPFILLAAVFATGCTERTEFGRCIGVAGDKDPELAYDVSGWNIAMAVIFSETIVVPIVVLANETSCPVARKPLREPAKLP